MANELKTRILLRYDSYANWTSVNPPLEAGEVAIAKLVSGTTINVDEAKNAPVLFKVGPGNYNDLPFVSALAADVHTWAKKSEAEFITWVNEQIEHPILEIVDDGEGQFITGITVDKDNNRKITITRGNVDLSEYAKKDEIPTSLGVMSVAPGNDAIEVGGTATDPTVAVKLNATQGNVTLTVEGGLKAAIDLSAYATNDALNGVKAIAEAAATKEYTDAELAKKADKTALEATDATLAEVKTTVDNFFSSDAAIEGAVDTLKEIAQYIANDKEGAADITARVGALETKVDVDKVSTAIAAAKTELQAEIDADVKVLADGAVADNTAAIGTINETLSGYGDIVTHNANEFATLAQGQKADSAVQKVTVLGKELTNGGELTVEEGKAALGLGTAAYANLADFVSANAGAANKTATAINVGEDGKLTVTYSNIAIVAEQVTDFSEAFKTTFESYDYIVCGGAQL